MITDIKNRNERQDNTMFEWKVEDMALMNEKSNIYINDEKIYNDENKLSRKEKIEFLDKMNDDKISYMLKLADKFQEDKDKLSKDEYGFYKDASLRAWLKKNDYRGIVDTSKTLIGSITLVGYDSFGYGRRNIQNINLQARDDCRKDYVDELFHRQLKICEKQEVQYFNEHDEYKILSRKVSEYMYKYDTSFDKAIWRRGDRLFFKDSQSYCGRDLTMDELKVLEAAFEKLKDTMDEITKSLPEMNYDNEYKTKNDNVCIFDNPRQDNLRQFTDLTDDEIKYFCKVAFDAFKIDYIRRKKDFIDVGFFTDEYSNGHDEVPFTVTFAINGISTMDISMDRKYLYDKDYLWRQFLYANGMNPLAKNNPFIDKSKTTTKDIKEGKIRKQIEPER